MIVTINYQKLWVSEFIQFLKDVINICKQNDPAKLKIDNKLEPMIKSVNELDAVFKMEQGSDLTEKIATLDERRDRALICLNLLVKGYTNYFEDDKCQAAEKIRKVLDKYGDYIYKLNYQAETTTLTNLVNDLESDNGLNGSVKALALQPLVDELKTSNMQFNEKYIARVNERSEAPKESAVELRKIAVQQYRDLVDLIEAWVIISGPDNYQKLIDRLNELIEKYNETVVSRNEDEEPEAEGEAEAT